MLVILSPPLYKVFSGVARIWCMRGARTEAPKPRRRVNNGSDVKPRPKTINDLMLSKSDKNVWRCRLHAFSKQQRNRVLDWIDFVRLQGELKYYSWKSKGHVHEWNITGDANECIARKCQLRRQIAWRMHKFCRLFISCFSSVSDAVWATAEWRLFCIDNFRQKCSFLISFSYT